MAFYIYDITFLVIFSLAVIIFLYKRKKNLQREGIMYLYRTHVGIKLINYVGEKYKRTLKVLSYFSVICGYFLMVIMIYLLGQLAYIYFKSPEIVRAIKVPPLMPLIPYLPSLFKIDFLPPFYFTYWIIAIAIIAVFHEFAHGIFAKYNGIKIKTTGFGFLGPFLAAFVEPDEKQMQKKSKFVQITILSAGTFTNLILAIIFFLLLSVFFVLSYVPAGAMFNTYTPGVANIAEINKIDGINVENLTRLGLLEIIEEGGLETDLTLEDNGESFSLVKIDTELKSYYISPEILREQLQTDTEQIILYEDLPAINAGLKGAITEIDGTQIKSYNDLAEVMKKYAPGDEIVIKTKSKEELLEYTLVLAEDSNQKGKAVIGIGIINQNTRMISKVSEFFIFFKEPATHYEPRFNTDLIIFIYNLIWWIALVNISVALINMLPMGIFDGGRMFMLTIWGITKSEKFAQTAFKVMTYLILGVFLLLMLSWVFAII